MEKQKENGQSRRRFIGNMATAAAGFTILPSYVVSGLGYKMPSDKLNIAAVGVGGVGASNVRNCAMENIVALCDVDTERMKGRVESFKEKYPDKTVPYEFQDYKKMFAEIGDKIDAVIIATPDHSHAIITLYAMKLGKHVYCQKPLTHSVYESRMLTRAAEKYNVATQMGNRKLMH